MISASPQHSSPISDKEQPVRPEDRRAEEEATWIKWQAERIATVPGSPLTTDARAFGGPGRALTHIYL